MTGPIELIEGSIFSTLSGYASLTDALGGTLIYNRVAPPGSTDDGFVIFQYLYGGDENTDSQRSRDVTYIIKGVADTVSRANEIDGLIDEAIHFQELSIAGWNTIWVSREGDINYSEVAEGGKNYYHTGGKYRIRMNLESDSQSVVSSFMNDLVSTFGANEVYRLSDISTGTTIPAYVDQNRNGVLSGWSLQSAATPVVGDTGLAPYTDGVNDYGNIFTPSLASIFNGKIGSLIIFLKFDNASNWDGLLERIVTLGASNGDLLVVQQEFANSLHYYYYAGGGTSSQYVGGQSSLDWMCLGMSWADSVSGASVKGYLNGVRIANMTPSTQWTGTLNTALIGAQGLTGSTLGPSGWLAWMAVKFGSIWSETDFLNIYNAAIT